MQEEFEVPEAPEQREEAMAKIKVCNKLLILINTCIYAHVSFTGANIE